jgi:hypothetical protein
MNLLIRIEDAPGVPGGKAIMLCSEHGVPLPHQKSVVLDQSTNEMSSITVTFGIDGESIKFET